MVRKRIRKILSGGAVVFIVLLCTLDVSYAQFGGAAVTYTITGSTGVPGVTMSGFPSQNGQTVVTDQNGFYSVIVKYGWSGTVKPVKEGWKFEPESRPYQKVTANMDNENYTPSEITYTISGKVTGPTGPMSGVQIAGLPGSPITGADGAYSATVPYNWSETFTPVKQGYTFTPSDKQFGPAKSDQVQNFSASVVQLLITGTVGVPGVKMKGLPGDPVTGANGIFSTKVPYNWNGTITPEKEGYVFEPAEMPYNNIVTDQTNQTFYAKMLKYVISGSAGMAGVTMKGLPDNPSTDQNGFFSVEVEYGFSGTVTPTKEGYNFDPASFILANVNSDRTNLNCTGEMIKLKISGTVGIEGVEMNGLPGNPKTDKTGKYSATVPWGWNGTVMPIKEGYKFNPENKTYPVITANATNDNYTYSKLTYTITGNAQLGGVAMKGFPGVRPVITDASGNYTATVEYGWTGTVTPAKEGYEFQPANIPFTNIVGPQTGQDFVGSLLQRKISGTVRTSKGQPVVGVDVVADNNGGQATTDATGQFEIAVGYGWSGSINPVKEGYTFNPSFKRIPRVTTDQMNQTFIANPKMFTISGAVNLGGVPIDGVLITATSSDGSVAPVTTVTNQQGKYSFQVPYGWSGDVAPTKEGIVFNPPSVPLIDVKTDIKDGQPVAPPPPKVVTPVVKPGPTPKIEAPGGTTPKIEAPGGTAPTIEAPGGTAPTIEAPGGAAPKIEAPGAPAGSEVKPTTPEGNEMAKLQKQINDLKAALAGTSTAGGPGVPEATDASGQPLISNSWMDNDLALDVLPAVSEQAGIPIIPDEGVTGTLITMTLKNEPLERALTLILAGTPFNFKKMDGYYVVAKAELKDSKFVDFSVTRRVRLNYITAQAALGLLSTAFQPYVQAEAPQPEQRLAPGTKTYSSQVPETYTVVVTAPPKLMERIIADLKDMDRMPNQVLLKARIVSMARTDLLNLGVEWGWPTIQVGAFAGNNYGAGVATNDFGGKAPWGIQMGYTPDLTFTNALQLALNLLTINGEATIRAEPQVMALDGKQATMRVINEEYFFLTANTGNSAQQFYYNSQLETIESGTTLTITPHIVEGDQIMLNVSVEVSDSIPSGRDTGLPIVTRRTADNTVTVQNGGTVALAGLSQEKSSTTHKRTPGLSNIPLLGSLFNNQDDQTKSEEVAVFVTAYILPKGQNDAATASIPRAASPAPKPGYSLPPQELERTAPKLQPHYNNPINRGTTIPDNSRYYPPTGSIRNTTPVYPPDYHPPVINPNTNMGRGGSFQDQISQELNRTQ